MFPRILIAAAVLLTLALSSGPSAAATANPYYTDIGQFNYAAFLMDEGDNPAAAREFARLIENFPASPLIPEAQFRMGDAYLHAGDYREAERQFSLFASNFVDSPFAPVAEIKMREARERRKAKAPVPLPELYREMRPGLRAVQVMLFEGRTYDAVEQEIRRLKDSGIDTVILRVFHNAGDRYYPFAKPAAKAGVYFATNEAPVVEDILPRVVEIAHRNGIRVFAWMTTRYADYGAEAESEAACVGYDLGKKEYSRCKGLDLFNEKAMGRLERLYSDLARNEIDGVLFQDDLVLRHNEGFGPSAAARFKADTGSELVPEALYVRGENGSVHYTKQFWKWAAWKNRTLVAGAERLMHAVKRQRPGAMFAINLMYESVTNPASALAWLSQDLGEAKKGGFDYFSIMAYHRQMGSELSREMPEIRGMIARMVEDASTIVGQPGRVLIKLQTIDWKTGQPLDNGEVVDLIREIRGVRDVSIAVVPYRRDFPFNELSAGRLAAGLKTRLEGVR